MITESNCTETHLIDLHNPSIKVPAYPAPWTLNGRGCILLYKFNQDFVRAQGFLPQDQDIMPAGGIGAVMVVDYISSEAGPYAELLFIPGKISALGRKWHQITKIYVSSMESVLNGRKNWSIPKEYANFNFSRKKNIIQVGVSNTETTFFQGSIKVWGPKFPISTKFLPFSLLQGEKDAYLNTKFTGTGMGRLALLSSLEVDQRYFPNLAGIHPLAVIYVDPFTVMFPKAKKIIP